MKEFQNKSIIHYIFHSYDWSLDGLSSIKISKSVKIKFRKYIPMFFIECYPINYNPFRRIKNKVTPSLG